MTATERYARILRALALALALLGGWLVASPFVLPGGEDVFTHVGVGAVTLLVAVMYLVRLAREPATKVPSIWYLLVLGVLLVSGAVLTHAPGTVFFWSTLLTGVLLVLLVAVSIYVGSRFDTGEGLETTIYER